MFDGLRETCRRRPLVGALALIALVAAGCQREDQGVLRRKGEPDYVRAFDERRMDAAVSEARATFETFVTALDAQEEGTDTFAIKKGFRYGTDAMEFIWITDVRRDGDGFVGEINNEPVNAVGVSLGQTTKVARADIADWMFLSRGVLRGGYTIVALAYGTPEQAEYDKLMKIDWNSYKFLQQAK